MSILQLGLTNIHNIIANNLYLRLGIDFTKPIHFYSQLTNSCNSSCKMCDAWANKQGYKDLPISDWIRFVEESQAFSKNIKHCFAGGEIFLKDGIFELLEFCSKSNIMFGITTNGILLNEENIKRLLALNPFNINISVDSLDGRIYEDIRGIAALEEVKSNINFLMKYKKDIKSDVVVTIKTIISRDNIDCLESIAKYVMDQNLNGVTFQPVYKKTKEADEMFRIDMNKLKSLVERLIEMNRKGYRILNSEKNMHQWINYFDANVVINNPCFVPLRSLYAVTNGNVSLCEAVESNFYNITRGGLKTAYESQLTKITKKKLLHCDEQCIYKVRRTFKEYSKIFMHYVKNNA